MNDTCRRMFATDFLSLVGGSRLCPAVGTNRSGGPCSGLLEMDVVPLPFPDLGYPHVYIASAGRGEPNRVHWIGTSYSMVLRDPFATAGGSGEDVACGPGEES